MQIDRTNKPRRTVRRTINAATAAEAVGPITSGAEIYGLSKGQFSLIELIEYLLDTTGPADLTISTWTAAGADLAHTAGFLADGRVRSCRWLVDFSFPSRQPGYCAQLVERFGDASVRTTANHAKFVMIRNDKWNVVVRTSMNLNLNLRLESYEISDDADLADWLSTIVDDAFDGGGALVTMRPSAARDTINSLGGTLDRHAPRIAGGSTSQGVNYGTGLAKGVSYE